MRFIAPFILLLSMSLSIQAQNAKKKKQLTDLAEGIVLAIEENNEDFLDKAFDLEAFADRIIIKGSSAQIQDFNAGFIKSLEKHSLLNRLLLQVVVNSGAHYDLVRAYFDEKEPHLIFRLFGDEGINYHDYLIRKIKGEYKVIDIYVYLTGEYLSDTYKRIYLMGGKEYFDSAQTAGMPELTMEDLTKLGTIRELYKQGEYKAADEVMQSVKEEVRNEKIFRLMDVQVKSNLDDNVYIKVMQDYRDAFPDDPSIDLISIDLFVYSENYQAAHQAVDNVNDRVGGDTFLDFYRGYVYYAAGDHAKAETALLKFTDNYPAFDDGPFYLLAIYIESERFEKAISVFQDLINDYGFTREDLISFAEEETDYVPLVNSEAYKTWKKN